MAELGRTLLQNNGRKLLEWGLGVGEVASIGTQTMILLSKAEHLNVSSASYPQPGTLHFQ